MMEKPHNHLWKPGYEEVFCDCGEVLELEALARIMNVLLSLAREPEKDAVSLPQHPVDDSEYRRPS